MNLKKDKRGEKETIMSGSFEGIVKFYLHNAASLMVQTVKNLPTMQETWVQSLVWEDPLEKEMAAHSCILAWRILWTE